MRLMRIVLLCIGAMLAGELQGAATRPSVAVEPAGCVTAECHVQVKQFKVLHGPVTVNACESCHKLTDAKEHRFEPARPGKELCTFCHELNITAPVVHQPVMAGDCASCHNPHGGKTRSMVRGNSVREVCSTCHQDVAANKKNIHGPVAAGACDSCHASHASNFKNLLNVEGNALCFDCHRDMSRQLAQAKVKHKALDGKCSDCHDAHASDHVMQIRKEPTELCLSCHEKELAPALNGKHKHSVVTKDKACLNCHTSHGGQLADLMKDEPVKLCMECHNKPTKASDGRAVAAVAEVQDPKLVKHGPIRDGNCSGCHNTHGSEFSKLLSKNYPDAFYQKYADNKYELCFSCHDKQLVQTAQAQGLTGFRNGQRNLHFEHVNRDKGRNCRSCHSTHASPNELHVRNTVPFGGWEMPIGFRKTTTGGSCTPGCHVPYQYDREKPAVYDAATQPATAPAKEL